MICRQFSTLILVMVSWVLLGSCGKREVGLDRETMRAIDTIAAREIKVVNDELDSLCALQFNDLVLHALDSILAVREKEMEILQVK